MQIIDPMFIRCCDQSLQRTKNLWGASEYNHIVTLDNLFDVLIGHLNCPIHLWASKAWNYGVGS